MKMLLPREKEALAYSEQLKKRHRYSTEIRKILHHKHEPALIKKRKNIQPRTTSHETSS